MFGQVGLGAPPCPQPPEGAGCQVSCKLAILNPQASKISHVLGSSAFNLCFLLPGLSSCRALPACLWHLVFKCPLFCPKGRRK